MKRRHTRFPAAEQGNNNIYRALPVETLFGELPGNSTIDLIHSE